MKLFGKNLRTRKEWLKLLIITVSSLVFLSAFTFGAVKVTNTSKFCLICHEMRPEYVTWEASAHSKFNCTVCHLSPGFGNLVKFKLGLIKKVFEHFTNNYVTPVEIDNPIKNTVCLKCHNQRRNVSPAGDIKFPHQKHLQEKLDCIQCHSGVVHGRIEENGFTTDTDYSTWTPGMGRAYLRPDFAKTNMSDCIDCHEAKDVPTTCNTCHNEMVKPPSHQSPRWLQNHGHEAMDDYMACDRCHSKTGSWVNNSKDDGVKGYVRNNTFCLDCHTKNRPPSHVTEWRNVHGSAAKLHEQDCLICHSESRVANSLRDTVAQPACSQCHIGTMHNSVLKGNMHPFPLNGQHLNAETCYGCHSEQTCGKCHYFKMPDRLKAQLKK